MKLSQAKQVLELAGKATKNFDDYTYNRSSKLTYQQKVPIALFQAAANPQFVSSLIQSYIEAVELIDSFVERYFDLPPEERFGPKTIKESNDSLRAREFLKKVGE